MPKNHRFCPKFLGSLGLFFAGLGEKARLLKLRFRQFSLAASLRARGWEERSFGWLVPPHDAGLFIDGIEDYSRFGKAEGVEILSPWDMERARKHGLTHRRLEKEGKRRCDRCGQPLYPKR